LTFRYPNYPDKHRLRAFWNPSDMLAYERSVGLDSAGDPPEALALVFQSSLFDDVVDELGRPPTRTFRRRPFALFEGSEQAGVMSLRSGAPAATVDFEHAVAWGVRRFVLVGTAGALGSSLSIGDLVLCERALRDEGTSHHYAEPSRYAYPSGDLTEQLAVSLESLGNRYERGTTWTTDAPYRETEAEIRTYREEGVHVVDMEAAALFCVARRRDVAIAACFAVSDLLGTPSWRPAFHDHLTRQGALRLVDAARAALSARAKAPD
jgi:uridine phosphorylase